MNKSQISKLISEIQDASQLLKNNRRGEALLIYHDVKGRTERNPAIELQLGYLCEEFGDVDEAIKHYEVVAEEAPENASNLSTLGIAYLNSRSYDKAKATLESALEVAPDAPEVQHGLGIYYMRRSDFTSAIEHLERACELRPRDVSARINFAASLASLNRHDDALKQIQRAVKLDKSNALAMMTMSDILAQAGDMEASIKQVEQVVQKHPYLGAAYDHLARMRKFTKEDTPLMKKAEKALQRGMPPPERVNLLFALGKMHDDCGNYDEAFSFFEQGNLLRKTTFDLSNNIKVGKAHMKAFTRKTVEQYSGCGNPSRQPVFIVGMPRSGTTLMERIIASHPDGAGSGELVEIPSIGQKVFPMSDLGKAARHVPAEMTPEKTAEFSESYLGILRQGHDDPNRIVDKMPGNFQSLGLIKSLFPNATIINAVRHPLDTCLSCYFQNFMDLYWTNELKMIGEVYTMYRETMEYWRNTLPEGAVVDIRYEDLVEDPETHGRRLIEACDLEWDPSVLEFYKKKSVVRTASIAQTRQKIYKTSRARWLNYAQHLQPLVNEISPYLEDDRELLAEHGVELSSGAGWLKRFIS